MVFPLIGFLPSVPFIYFVIFLYLINIKLLLYNCVLFGCFPKKATKHRATFLYSDKKKNEQETDQQERTLAVGPVVPPAPRPIGQALDVGGAQAVVARVTGEHDAGLVLVVGAVHDPPAAVLQGEGADAGTDHHWNGTNDQCKGGGRVHRFSPKQTAVSGRRLNKTHLFRIHLGPVPFLSPLTRTLSLSALSCTSAPELASIQGLILSECPHT